MPRTLIRKLEKSEIRKFGDWVEGRYSEEITTVLNDIKVLAKSLRYPIFLRTDLASGKHSYKDSCYVLSEKNLERNLAGVIEFNQCADIMGLPFEAIVVREFIKLEAPFKAFWGELPIAKERRYFIKDGKIDGRYPYWPEGAIKRVEDTSDLPNNWKKRLTRINKMTFGERKLLSHYAELVAEVLDGYWSIDFAKGQNGKWYLIDMATGERSWRPDDSDPTKT
jgi:hypothetical protein